MSKLIIVFHYHVVDSGEGQKPNFKILKVITDKSEFLQEQMKDECKSFGGSIDNSYMQFSSKEHMEDFFINWAEDNKIEQMNFLALSEFNYLIQNCHSIHDFTQNYTQYSQVWTQQSKKEESLFKGLFKQ